jgi:hypothetical protein
MTARADKKHFTAAEVYKATGVPQRKTYQWDDRSVTVPSRKDKLATQSGDPHLRSIETVYQIAITAALISVGLLPKRAARAARKFTDEGQTGRAPGALFARGRTVLKVTPDSATVQNIFPDTAFTDVCNSASVIIVCDDVVQQVDSLLTQKVSKNG